MPFVRVFGMSGTPSPTTKRNICHQSCRGRLSSADSVKPQNDCHRQSATSTPHKMFVKLCGGVAESPDKSRPLQKIKNIKYYVTVRERQNDIGFPKNEGCTRNFLGRGNAAPQVMNFIVIKFEQAKRALTRQRAIISIYFIFLAVAPYNLRRLFACSERFGTAPIELIFTEISS